MHNYILENPFLSVHISTRNEICSALTVLISIPTPELTQFH